MNKKIHYTNKEGVPMKRVVLSLEINYTGQIMETVVTVPKSMTDEEIMNMARDFRDSEIKCGFYYPDEN